MSPPMYRVADDLPGCLWLMPCPASAQLSAQIAAYRAAGVTRLVSMQPIEEATALGLKEQEAACAVAGLTFHRHPIADFGLPDLTAFTGLTGQIVKWLHQGEGVSVHCRAGIGRSGMVVSGVLITMGQTAQDAMRNVSAVRGALIPDTVEQATFLASFEGHLRR